VRKKAEMAEAIDVQTRFGFWKQRATQNPVIVRNGGQDEIVMVSADEYNRLKRRDREVLGLEDFTDEDIDEIKKAKVPAEYAYLDDEIKDWTP
jgi:PHD/YefM family antitoxin component YafN of YafNO toxin-antitoxin module